MVDQIVAALVRRSFRFQTEDEFQAAIAQALEEDGIAFERERRLDIASRIDFLVDDVGVEVKIKGSPAQLLRQLFRYSLRPEIAQLLLVTSKRTFESLPLTINGKRLDVLTISRAFQ